jgi:AraC family transcriptional regulator, L-rhamnose operon transcriptional activator RhaR
MAHANPLIFEGHSYFKDSVPVSLNISTELKENRCMYHKHDFIEIAYVSSGRGVHWVGNERYPVSKGTLAIINYDIPHVFIQNEEDKDGDFIVQNCIFKPEFIDYSLINSNDFKDIATSLLFNTFFIEDRPAINLHLSSTHQMEIEAIYKKMYMEYNTTPRGYVNILRSCLVEMLTKIFRLLESGDHQRPVENHKSEIIKKALDFLKTNYFSHELNIDEVAIKTFLSRSYFSKLFKEVTGQNFLEYVQNLRISEACLLLETTDKKITEILLDVGFKDIKHFNRLFKKITGKTPREYRKRELRIES